MVKKQDWRKDLKPFYAPRPGVVTRVDVPTMPFLMLDGAGDPNGSAAYAAVVEALYALAYTIKFDVKKSGAGDFAVFPLEGLWWAEDLDVFTADYQDKSGWKWTMMIAQPDLVDSGAVEEARSKAAAKKKLALLAEVRFEEYAEGASVQIMHVGPFATEGPDIEALHGRIAELGGSPRGHHHEVYLSDPRRVAPEKLKTVIRQPYRL